MKALNGFTPYPHELEAQIFACSGALTKSELLLLMLILRYTAGYQRQACELSYGDIGKVLGLCKMSVSRAIKGLEEKQIIFKKTNGKINTFQVNYDFRLWKTSNIEVTSNRNVTSNTEVTITSNSQVTRHLLKENTKEITTTTAQQQEKPVEKLKNPVLKEVISYAKELGQTEALAEKFWQYYQLTGWKTKGGAPVEDWKSGFLFWMANEKKERMPKPAARQKKAPLSDNAEAYQGFVVNLDKWDDSGISSRASPETSETPVEALECLGGKITPEATESGLERRTEGLEGKLEADEVKNLPL